MTDFAGLLLNAGIPHQLPMVLAQSSAGDDASAAASAGSLIVQLLFYVALYVFTSFCGQTILNKLNYENSWLAWVPIASTYAYLEAGEQEEPLIWTIVSLDVQVFQNRRLKPLFFVDRSMSAKS